MWRCLRRGCGGSWSCCWGGRVWFFGTMDDGRWKEHVVSSWLSGLFGRRKDEESVGGDEAGKPEYDDPGDAPVSPLAMMNEKSQEAWLGQCLTIVGAPPALQFSTIKAAKQDERLAEHLRG